MNNSDYLNISEKLIEPFNGGNGSVGGGNFAGSGSFGSARGSSSRSPLTNSQGGGKQNGSFGYASVSPTTGAMSGLANVQPGSNSGLGVIMGGAKTGSFTGGSFGGDGKYVVGFPGIKPGSNLPASSMPSMYIKPKPKEVKSAIAVGPIIVPEVTRPYGRIENDITPGIPGPRIGNKYDNVNHNHATKIRGPKFPYGVNLKDKNLTGYYGYSGYGYGFDPFYWGYGPFWPITNTILDYPDIPFDYESLMQKEVNADYLVNTIQNQIATQILEKEENERNLKEENENKEETPEKKDDNKDNNKNEDKKEGFESNQPSCNKNTTLIILAVVLIIYLLLILPTSS
jgi:hypothetical protein